MPSPETSVPRPDRDPMPHTLPPKRVLYRQTRNHPRRRQCDQRQHRTRVSARRQCEHRKEKQKPEGRNRRRQIEKHRQDHKIQWQWQTQRTLTDKSLAYRGGQSRKKIHDINPEKHHRGSAYRSGGSLEQRYQRQRHEDSARKGNLPLQIEPFGCVEVLHPGFLP